MFEQSYLAASFMILWRYHAAFLSGLRQTLALALITWGAGLGAGSLLGYAGARCEGSIGALSRWCSFILSGVPVLVFLFWLHYPLQSLLGIVIDPFFTSAFAFSVINVFAVSDLVRAQVRDFPQQYLLAAKVCGLSPGQTMLRIELPIILRQILPGLLMLQVSMLHMTLFASLISVDEVFRTAQHINADCYKPVEIYTALGIFFLCASLPLNALALWLKKKFSRSLSER